MKDRHCPDIGVGVEAGGFPNVKNLNYDCEWDIGAKPADTEEFKEFANQKSELGRQSD